MKLEKIIVKTGRITEACERYGMGKSAMRRLAEEAGAIRRIGRILLIDFDAVDTFIDNNRNMNSLFQKKA